MASAATTTITQPYVGRYHAVRGGGDESSEEGSEDTAMIRNEERRLADNGKLITDNYRK
jgi:hypothetical protein